PIIGIQEAGLDGFWLHRVLQQEGIESYVVDPASIATSRRRRWAKTDKIDGEALVRALLAYKRGASPGCVRAATIVGGKGAPHAPVTPVDLDKMQTVCSQISTTLLKQIATA